MELDVIIGIGLAIFIAVIFTLLNLKRDADSPSGVVFFVFLTIGFSISVYAGLLDLWYWVISAIFMIFVIIFQLKSGE